MGSGPFNRWVPNPTPPEECETVAEGLSYEVALALCEEKNEGLDRSNYGNTYHEFIEE